MEQEATSPNPKEKKTMKNQSWTKEESEFLIHLLAEEARSGKKPEKGFKSCQYKAATRALNEKFMKNFSECHILNHMKTIKRKWKIIRDLRFKRTGLSFDSDTNTIIMGEEEYKAHIQTHPTHVPYLNKPMPYYQDMEMICNSEMASGASAMDNNGSRSFSRVPPPSSPEVQINSFNVIREEADEEAEMTPGVQSANNQRVNNPAGSKKRKRKEEDANDKLCMQVGRMASAIEYMCSDKTVRYAKDLMEQLMPLQGEFSDFILMEIQ